MAVLAAFAGYVVLHSPLRGLIHRSGDGRVCYLCPPSVPGWSAPAALAALVLVVTATLAAASVVRSYSGPRFERPLVFGLAVAGFATVPAAVVGGVASASGSALLRPPLGPLLAAVPAAVVVVVQLRAGWRPSLPSLSLPGRRSPLLRVAFGCAAVVTVLAAAGSLLHPPSQGDALTYHAPLAVFLWSDGNLTTMLDRSPGLWSLAHPGTAALWAGLLRVLGGERLADLCQLPAALLGAAAVAAFARRTGLRDGAAMLAGCAFLLVPMVALQIGTQADDLTGAAFLMTAIALTSAPPGSWSGQRAAVVGLSLGLAATTKLALLPAVAATAVAAGVLLMRAGRRGLTRRFTALALPFVVVVAPWWLRNLVREGNPIFPQALPFVGHGVDVSTFGPVDGTFVPSRWAWPLYPLLEAVDDRSGFGALFCVALLPGLVVAFRRGRRLPLVVLGWSVAVMVPFWWAYTLHEPRFFLAEAGLALVSVPWALAAVAGRARTVVAGVLACAAVLSAVLVLQQQVVPLAAQPTARAEFYDRVYAVDPAVSDLDERTGLLQLTGRGLPQVDYTSTYPLLGPGQHRHLVSLDFHDIGDSPEVVVDRMRAAGLRFVYVTAVPAERAAVERFFARPAFRLAHSSQVAVSGGIGARRALFRDVAPGAHEVALRRYLFELVDPGRPG